ncbi:hypothetical protein GOBAR_DD31611 [Gossypium barbadense]|nr:hypothetical protein GOBAR_DD31611 [Gossypium barbadense]
MVYVPRYRKVRTAWGVSSNGQGLLQRGVFVDALFRSGHCRRYSVVGSCTFSRVVHQCSGKLMVVPRHIHRRGSNQPRRRRGHRNLATQAHPNVDPDPKHLQLHSQSEANSYRPKMQVSSCDPYSPEMGGCDNLFNTPQGLRQHEENDDNDLHLRR